MKLLSKNLAMLLNSTNIHSQSRGNTSVQFSKRGETQFTSIREGLKKNCEKAVRLTAWVDPPLPSPEAVRKM